MAEEEKTFTSKLVRTSNVAKELLAISKEYDLSVQDLDMNLIKTEMYIKELDETKKEGDAALEFKEADESDLRRLSDPEVLANPNLFLKQVYDVEIIPAGEPLYPDLDMTISGNKTLTAVYAVIKAGSKIVKSKNSQKDLLDYFNKRKLRANILIDMWDEEMVSELAKIAAKAEINEEYVFAEDTKLLVSKSLGAVATVDDELELHFDEKHKNEDDYGRIDYKERGFITSVEIGELLVTYRKPKTGSPGRNCRGVFVEVPESDGSHLPTFDIDEETIEIKEDDEKIQYFSKKNGYIDKDGTTYYIKEELEVSEISFKSTGNVNAGLNTDIAIKVKENDAYKDAIGMGVTVEATEVDVEGNVGSNSSVKAKSITIGGQTHQTSVLEAPKIKVNLHRGLAKGEDVEIKRLEQGKVEGETVYIEQAAGGEVYGRDVTLEIVASHVKVVASNSITIKKMKGSENSFSIDQTRIGENTESMKSLEKAIDDTRIEINLAKKELDEHLQKIEKHKDAILEIKKRLAAYKKAGAKMPQSFVQKYKEFQALQMHVSNLKKEYELKQEEHQMLQDRRSNFQSSVLNAKIINYGLWRGHNEVTFRLTNPNMELSYVPKEGLKESSISIKHDEETDEYKVVATSAAIGGADTTPAASGKKDLAKEARHKEAREAEQLKVEKKEEQADT